MAVVPFWVLIQKFYRPPNLRHGGTTDFASLLTKPLDTLEIIAWAFDFSASIASKWFATESILPPTSPSLRCSFLPFFLV